MSMRDKIKITKDVRIPGTNVILERGDTVSYKDSMPKKGKKPSGKKDRR